MQTRVLEPTWLMRECVVARIIFAGLALLFAVLVSANCAAATTPSNATVRVAYIVPSNRAPQEHAVATLRNAVLLYQEWFTGQMQINGAGQKTFTVETEADGVTPLIHVLSVAKTDSFLRGDIYGNRVLDAARDAGLPIGAPGQLWWLIPETHVEFPDGSISGSFEFGFRSPATPMDSGWAMSGSERLALYQSVYQTNALPYENFIVPEIGPYPLLEDVSFPWFEGKSLSGISSSALGGGLRSIVEAFGLNPDYRNDENFNGNLMGFGFRGIRGMFYPKTYPYNYCSLSYASALALNVNPFFNPGRAVAETNAPSITITTSGTRTPVNGLLQIAFQASDNSPLHAALLTWESDSELIVIDEMTLAGTSVTRTFAVPYFNSAETNRYTITVFDQQGNRRSAQTSIFSQATANRAPQPFIVISPLVAGPGQDVVLDASGTFDPEHSTDLLKVEWDLDGNGSFDTPSASGLAFTNHYFTFGSRIIRARITDSLGVAAVSAPAVVSIVPCPATLSPSARTHGFGGSTGAIAVTVGPQCQWSVVNTNDWVTILSGASGAGSGQVTYRTLANPAFAERQGTLLIGDQLFTVRQRAIECTFSLSPTNRFHGFGLGSGTFKVTTKSDCAWFVENTNSWITVTSGSGIATGNVSYIVSTNRVAGRRAGNLVVGGEVFTVNQWGLNCDLVLNLASRAHSENSETGLVSVAAPSGCSWQVENPNSWITITTLTSGDGSGSFGYLVAANPGLTPRTGVLAVNGQPFTVTQQSCSYTLTPSSRGHSYLGQTGSVSVTAGGICEWTVGNSSGWLTIVSGVSGPGHGTIVYTISQNPTSNQRTTALTVAGQSFTVTQSGQPCGNFIEPEEFSHGETGGVGEVLVTAESGCFWSVINPPPWITILAGASGEGAGRVTYRVDANDGPGRDATLTIAGQEYAVSQASAVRLITAGAMTVASGRTNCVSVTLDAHGGENTLGFSLCFDTNLLVFRSAALQGAPGGAALSIDSSQSASGRVGFTVAMPGGASMPAGAQPAIQVCLSARAVNGKPTTTLSICDTPVLRRLVNAAGNPLPASFNDGLINIVGLCTIADSLDAPQFNWVTGTTPWSCQTNVTHDGEDAVVSGATASDGESYFETTFIGPGVVSFWWKVSSEPSNDRLRLYLDGTGQFQISGEVDWEWRTFNVPAGSHVLRWRYYKNGSTVAGSDRGWVDQIVYQPAPPSITTQPVSQSVDSGVTVAFNIVVAGQPPITYQWLSNGIALSDSSFVRGTRAATLTLSNVQPSQAAVYSVIVGNAAGNIASAAATLGVTPATTLGEALDAANRTWLTTGNAVWGGQPITTHDGIDAARSGAITHSQTTSFETTVSGPGVASFWWKVSSEPTDDDLTFFLNGSEQAAISGEVDWTQRTLNVPLGAQTLRWTYVKDSSTSAGQDRAWVDQFSFVPASVAITAQPISQAVDAGATAIFAVSVSGAPPFTYQWRLNGGNIGGATNTALTLLNAQPAQAGNYSVLVSNASGSVASSNASLQVAQIVPLAEALDATNFIWTTNGTPPWAGQTAVTHDGSDAARSGRIGDEQTTSFRTTVTGPGTVTFWWKVSSEEEEDELRFYIGSSARESISGEVNWTWRSWPVSSGSQVLEWRYVKNDGTAAGQDRGWVDQIYYVSSSTPTPPIVALQPTNRTVVAPATVTFTAFGVGSAPLSYQWFFNDTLLTNGNGVSGATTTNLTIANTSTARAGAYSVQITNAAGSVTSAVVTFTVITSPVITIQPPSQHVLLGSTANFGVAALGTAPLTYQWRLNGTNLLNTGNVSGVTTTNLRLTTVLASQAGSYSVVVGNAVDSITSSVATLLVSTAPTIAAQPASKTVVVGDTTSFTVGANGSGPLGYQWRLNGANLVDGAGVSGATSSTLALINVQSGAAGNYSVRITNAVGNVTSANALLTVLTPPGITSQPANRSVVEGTTATFNVAATGTAPLTYRWRRRGTNVVNGGNVSGATTTTLTLNSAQLSQEDNYSVEVSNAAGTIVSSPAQLTVSPILTLGLAVNAPYLNWTTNASGSWTPQTNVTHDGEAAAQSGSTANGGNSWIQTTIIGPGTIRFWWKVSSQTNADFFSFSVNGAEWAKISGEVDWQKLSFSLPPGSLTLRWTYAKDASATAGSDRAWLDEMDFLPSAAPSVPVILSEPQGTDVDPGATVSLSIDALGTAPLSYQWRLDGQNLSDSANILGANSSTLRLFNVQVAQSGLYDVVVRNNYGIELSDQVFVNVFPIVALPVALDTESTDYIWSTGGASLWRGQTPVNADRIDAAESGVLPHRATNWIQTIVPGPGVISFWWKVSSEVSRDRLRFLMNGIEQTNISGQVDWQRRTFSINASNATVRWEYIKDSSGTAGQDRGWVDLVEMLPFSPAVTNVVPDESYTDQGTTLRLKVDVTGTPPFFFQWRLNGTNLVETDRIFGATTSRRLILTNAQPEQSGVYSCLVGNAGGEVISPPIPVTIVPGLPLAPALNTPTWVWETGGYSWWVGTTNDSHDGVQSARNGTLPEGESTWMRTTVVGPGTLRFWWRAATQLNLDFLNFYMNGVRQAQISGNVAWQQMTFTVPDGPVTLQWENAKDILTTNDLGRVYVDEVTFAPAPPSITNQPVAQTVDEGSTVTFAAGVRGAQPLTYRWRLNGVPLNDGGNISGAFTTTLRITGVQVAQAGAYSLAANNFVGSITTSNTAFSVTPVLPLGQGMDATYLTWVTGSPPWIGQPIVSHDGVDAARSPALGNNESASAQATVTGPATVSFWWRVSSELNADYLIFSIGNSEQARISGEVNWQQRTFSVPAGNHTITWTYSKNGSGMAGQDRGWVDQFVFTPSAPAITANPASQVVEEGSRVTFSAAATGLAPLVYYWRFNGVNIPDGNGVSGARTTALTISNASPTRAGSYSLFVSNAASTATSISATLVVSPLVPLSVALDGTNLVWTTNGSIPWVGQQLVSHDGADAARSGVVANNGSNSIQTTLSGPGSISFWWKVSSEPVNDKLIFSINGVEQARISGEADWALRTFSLGVGSQTLRWAYSKNSSVTGGQDRAWIDQVIFTPSAATIAAQPTNQSVDAGGMASFKVTPGGTPPFTYQWQHNGEDLANGNGISGATASNLVLTGVQISQAGGYRVIVANAAGSASSAAAILAVYPALPLNVALDTTGLAWSTGGPQPWIGHASVTHDGIDAGRSGPIGNNTNGWMEVTVSGPNVVNFWWKVSSESSNDRLMFFVDGVEQARISGEVDWNFRSFNFTAGNHTLRWTYLKNGSTVAGQDRGWVDQVQFGVIAPTITIQPVSRLVGEDEDDDEEDVAFSVTAVGTAPLTYRWRFNGVPLNNGNGISGATTATLTISEVETARLGTYSVIVSNSAGIVISSNATLALAPTLAEALDTTGLSFTTGGTAVPWTGQRAVTLDGSDAAQSGATTEHGTYTYVRTTVSGPGTLVFWWKVSSEENNDYLRFMLDSEDQLRISGEVEWQRITFSVPSGSHVLQWRYARGSTGVGGQDRGWLDQVSYVRSGSPGPVQSPFILIQPASQIVDQGETVDLTVAAAGSDPLSYQWLLNGTNAIGDGGNIGGATTASLTVFNALGAQAGDYCVRVSNAAGSITSAMARLAVNRVVALAEAVDAPEHLFLIDGDAFWEGHTVITHDGMDAARSGLVGHGQSSAMHAVVDGPGTLSFWWKVSSEANGDELMMLLNGEAQASISGEVDWEQRSLELPPGPQLLEWAYVKNGSVTTGADRGWVDQISSAPGSGPAPTGDVAPRIAIVGNKTVLTWSAGAQRRYEVLYKDELSDLEWKRLDGEVLAGGEAGEPVAISEDLPATRSRFYRVLQY